MNRLTSFKTINISGKRLPLWISILVASVIVVAVAASIIWSGQHGRENRGYVFTGIGNKEITNNNIRIWASTTENTWSGMKTEQTWQFMDNLQLTAQISHTHLTNTFLLSTRATFTCAFS